MDFWTADRIETMRKMHHDGHTSRAIALAIGATRNQVIGKLHRLKIVTPATAEEWAPEDIETLKRMHIDGALYTEIATVLGRTTTACQNKANRIGLPSRGHNTFRRSSKTAAKAPKAFRPRLVEGIPAPSLDLAAGILDTTGCKWPVGEDAATPGRHLFCNHGTDENAAYCPYHSELNRAKPAPKGQVKRFVIPTSLLRAVA